MFRGRLIFNYCSRSIFVLVAILICSRLTAQSVVFNQINSQIQNVNALLEDDHGYLWIGTNEGLFRYDGYRFEHYEHIPFDTLSLSDNRIHSLLKDQSNRLWIGTERGLNVFDPTNNSFLKVDGLLNGKNTSSLSNLAIEQIFKDHSGNYWLTTPQQGIIQVQSSDITGALVESKGTYEIEAPLQLLTTKSIHSVAQDNEGTIWVASQRYLHRIIPNSDQLTYRLDQRPWSGLMPINFVNDKGELKQDFTPILFYDQREQLGMRIGKQILFWQASNDALLVEPIADYTTTGAGTIALSTEIDQLWVSTSTQLELKSNNAATQVAVYPYPKLIKKSLPNVLLADRAGNIWLGTEGEGLFNLPVAKHQLLTSAATSRIITPAPLAIIEYEGQIWWTTKEGQLMYKIGGDPPKKFMTKVGLQALLLDKQQQLWVGGHSMLYKIDLSKKQPSITSIFEIQKDAGIILDIYQDQNDQLWLLTPTYFGLFDQEEGIHYGLLHHLKQPSSIKPSGNNAIHQTSDGTFWLATNEGLKSYKQGDKDFQHFLHDPANPRTIAHDQVTGICPDPQTPDDILWISSLGGGLDLFSIKKQAFERFGNISNPLASQQLGGVYCDQSDQLWLLSNKGLSRCDPRKGNCQLYTKTDGLLSNAFEQGTAFCSNDGTLFFASELGINKFTPEDLLKQKDHSSLFFDNLVLYENGNAKPIPISPEEKLLIPANVDVFTITFAAVDLLDAASQQYRYILKGVHEEWQQIGSNTELTFSGLSSREYQLIIQHANSEGEWLEPTSTLSFIIQRPWWKQWWAYLIYASALLALMYVIYLFLLSRQLEKSEALRLKEMDGLRSRLYTNMTHEFRTPLTVIMGMTEELEEAAKDILVKSKDKSTIANGFSLIKRNSQQLLILINQLLDLAKLEDKKLSPNYIQADAISYLEYLCESFYSLAQDKELEIIFYPEQRPLLMDLDEVKWQQIVFNLISNAIKFTPAGGRILFHTEMSSIEGQKWLQIKINDTGRGIAADKLPHIFDRFYQVEDSSTRIGEGTGIGLAFTKELIELLGGDISVKSELNVGTTFVVRVPITHQAELTSLTVAKKESDEELPQETVPLTLPIKQSAETSDKPLILLVEDNSDVASYIQQILLAKYEVKWAENGLIGKELALQLIPDLIISDVMMPGIDGFNLTEQLKADERTSHIPIILLTAKTTQDDKISGLRTGADAYLMKPFNKAELMIRLEKLLQLRQTLQTHYAKVLEQSPYMPTSAENLPSQEELFLQKLHRIILENLDNSEFSVELLGKEVQLSPSQIYRKLKAVAHKTPIALIKEIRLRKAKELLISTDLNISEVAFSTGFSDPNYFSRAFHQHFGCSPKAYRLSTLKDYSPGK